MGFFIIYAEIQNSIQGIGFLHKISGGDEGIRTLDTVAGIPHFQCGALDQLCDVSRYYYSSMLSADSPTGSSDNALSNSASISRSNGSSLETSRPVSSALAIGASLYDWTNS